MSFENKHELVVRLIYLAHKMRTNHLRLCPRHKGIGGHWAVLTTFIWPPSTVGTFWVWSVCKSHYFGTTNLTNVLSNLPNGETTVSYVLLKEHAPEVQPPPYSEKLIRG